MAAGTPVMFNESAGYDLAGRDLASDSVNVGRVFYGGCHFACGTFPYDCFCLFLVVG